MFHMTLKLVGRKKEEEEKKEEGKGEGREAAATTICSGLLS